MAPAVDGFGHDLSCDRETGLQIHFMAPRLRIRCERQLLSQQRERPHTVRSFDGDEDDDGLPEFVGVSVRPYEALWRTQGSEGEPDGASDSACFQGRRRTAHTYWERDSRGKWAKTAKIYAVVFSIYGFEEEGRTRCASVKVLSSHFDRALTVVSMPSRREPKRAGTNSNAQKGAAPANIR